jgi:curved DNA-binding protein CbpA
MNFYEYLGVKETASSEEIRNAFRKLAKIKHPDHNKKDNAFWEMVELNIIRDTLLTPERRKAYNESLHTGKSEDYYPTHSTTGAKQATKSSLYKKVKSLFVYHCIVCGQEMSSTWKGYCLYHYLEATDQLYNEGFVFEYGNQKYRWADAPPELHELHRQKNPPHNSSTQFSLRPIHVAIYAGLIAVIVITIVLFILAAL